MNINAQEKHNEQLQMGFQKTPNRVCVILLKKTSLDQEVTTPVADAFVSNMKIS